MADETKSLTAAEVKSILEPLRQFAPAFYRIDELIVTAEDAERRLTKATQEENTTKAALQKDIAELEIARTNARAANNKERNEFKEFTEDVIKNKAALTAGLKQAHEETAKAIAELEAKKKAKQKEFDDIAAVVAAKKAEHDALEASYNSWKRERKLG